MTEDIMELIFRLREVVNHLEISEREFAARVEIGQRSINYYLKGEQKPSLDLICNLSKAYPDISLDWLITGKGEMFKNTYQNVSEKLPVAAEPITNYSSLKDEHFEVLRENRMLRKEIEELRKKMAKTA